jgi:hypothetical protein
VVVRVISTLTYWMGINCCEKVNYQVGGRESTRRDGINSVSERERYVTLFGRNIGNK